jgi:hypothetical protein
MDYSDCFDFGESDCCGASIYLGGICSNCKDHTEARKEEIDKEIAFDAILEGLDSLDKLVTQEKQ